MDDAIVDDHGLFCLVVVMVGVAAPCFFVIGRVPAWNGSMPKIEMASILGIRVFS
jgi:hypothetical protein